MLHSFGIVLDPLVENVQMVGIAPGENTK